MPVREITDANLVSRAMLNLMPHAGDHPRWVAVMETFGLGSTYAHELCAEHDLDPDEVLHGPVCEVCAENDQEPQHVEDEDGPDRPQMECPTCAQPDCRGC